MIFLLIFNKFVRLSEAEESSLMAAIKLSENLKSCDKEFNKLYKSIFQPLKNKLKSKYSRFITSEDFDDLIQDSFRKLLENRTSYLEGSNVFNWIYTITNNNILNFLKKNKREIDFSTMKESNPEFDLYEIKEDGVSLENQIVGNDIIYQIIKEINKIDDKTDREIIYMKIIDDLNYQEISKKMNLAISTIHKRLNKRIVILKMKLSNCL